MNTRSIDESEAQELKFARSWRSLWIEQHPDYKRAAEGVILAEEAAKQVPWNADPDTYLYEVKAALKAIDGAKATLMATEADLKRRYDEQMGTGD